MVYLNVYLLIKFVLHDFQLHLQICYRKRPDAHVLGSFKRTATCSKQRSITTICIFLLWYACTRINHKIHFDSFRLLILNMLFDFGFILCYWLVDEHAHIYIYISIFSSDFVHTKFTDLPVIYVITLWNPMNEWIFFYLP